MGSSSKGKLYTSTINPYKRKNNKSAECDVTACLWHVSNDSYSIQPSKQRSWSYMHSLWVQDLLLDFGLYWGTIYQILSQVKLDSSGSTFQIHDLDQLEGQG